MSSGLSNPVFYGPLVSSTAFLLSPRSLVGVSSTGHSTLGISLSPFTLMVEFQESGEKKKYFFLASSNLTTQIAVIFESSNSKVRLRVCLQTN